MTHGSHVESREKHYGSHTVWLTDEGWQKAMPEQIELWDISSLDSFNKQRACGGHQGQGSGQWGLAQYPEEGAGAGREGGGEVRSEWCVFERGGWGARGVVVSP